MTLNHKNRNYVIIASLTRETMGKLINRIPGSCLLISNLPGSALRTHVESLGKPRDVKQFSKPCLVNLISKDTQLAFSISYQISNVCTVNFQAKQVSDVFTVNLQAKKISDVCTVNFQAKQISDVCTVSIQMQTLYDHLHKMLYNTLRYNIGRLWLHNILQWHFTKELFENDHLTKEL